MKISRRSMFSATAAGALLGLSGAKPRTDFAFCGVEETPQLVGTVQVVLDGRKLDRCFRASAVEGWADVDVDCAPCDLPGETMFGGNRNFKRLRGEVQLIRVRNRYAIRTWCKGADGTAIPADIKACQVQ